MGLLGPGKGIGVIGGSPTPVGNSSVSEMERLEARARLPGSAAARFVRAIGWIIIVLSVFALVAGGAYGVAAFIFGVAVGGLTLAAASLQQTVYDIRTLILRKQDAAK